MTKLNLNEYGVQELSKEESRMIDGGGKAASAGDFWSWVKKNAINIGAGISGLIVAIGAYMTIRNNY